MPHLSIDIDRSTDLAATLQETSGAVDPILELLAEAATLSGIEPGVVPQLVELGADMAMLARSVTDAAATAAAFRVQVRGFSFSQRSPDARWDASPQTEWIDVHQQASHNSFAVDGGIAKLYEAGVRTFELDIHRGAPTRFWNSMPWPFGPAVTFFDQQTHTGGRPDDWLVYHHSVDTNSEYEYLSDGLGAIATLNSSDPITVFVDNKDAFSGPHTAAQFDTVLRDHLGDRLFTPSHLMERSPGAETLQDAIAVAGWPTVEELQGRVVVVLTDRVDGYEVVNGSAFVAASPQFGIGVDGELEHRGDPNVVVYNQDASKLTIEQLTVLQADGNLVRTYYNDICDEPIGDIAVNFRAVDHEFPETACEVEEPSGWGWPWTITGPTLWSLVG